MTIPDPNQKILIKIEARFFQKIGKIQYLPLKFTFQQAQAIGAMYIADYFQKSTTIFPDNGEIQYVLGYISGRGNNRERIYFNIIKVMNHDIVDPYHPYKQRNPLTTILTSLNEIKAMLPNGFFLIINQKGIAYKIDAALVKEQLHKRPYTTAPYWQNEVWN
jgi:hypothetical protein